jgi:hypothetical protein
MPLLNIARIEPVAAPNRMTEHDQRDNFAFVHKQSGPSRQNQSPYYKSHDQIVFMERSVQDFLGKNVNLYG